MEQNKFLEMVFAQGRQCAVSLIIFSLYLRIYFLNSVKDTQFFVHLRKNLRKNIKKVFLKVALHEMVPNCIDGEMVWIVLILNAL